MSHLTTDEQIKIIKELKKHAQKGTGPFQRVPGSGSINPKQRERMFYAKWFLIPKDERHTLIFDKPFINTLNDEQFLEYLRTEFAILEGLDNKKIKRDAFNPVRASAMVPFKPRSEDGETPISGSHEFDSVPESYEAESLTNLQLVEKLYKFTDNKKDFLTACKDHWFDGHFDGGLVEWSWDKFLVFLDEYIKIQYRRQNHHNRPTK